MLCGTTFQGYIYSEVLHNLYQITIVSIRDCNLYRSPPSAYDWEKHSARSQGTEDEVNATVRNENRYRVSNNLVFYSMGFQVELTILSDNR